MTCFLLESRIAAVSCRPPAIVGRHLEQCVCRDGRLRDEKPGLPWGGLAVNIAAVVEVDDVLCGEGRLYLCVRVLSWATV